MKPKRTIQKVKSRWYEFWKPKEKIIVITECNHRWDIVWEGQMHDNLDYCIGDGMILKCKCCGKIKRVRQ